MYLYVYTSKIGTVKDWKTTEHEMTAQNDRWQ